MYFDSTIQKGMGTVSWLKLVFLREAKIHYSLYIAIICTWKQISLFDFTRMFSSLFPKTFPALRNLIWLSLFWFNHAWVKYLGMFKLSLNIENFSKVIFQSPFFSNNWRFFVGLVYLSLQWWLIVEFYRSLSVFTLNQYLFIEVLIIYSGVDLDQLEHHNILLD